MATSEIPTSRSAGNISAYELERTLRVSLAGRRLVAEIGLDATAHQLHSGAIQGIVKRLQKADEVVVSYPALLVCYLVGCGIYRYDHGGLWPAAADQGVDHRFGPAFEKAVRRLGLETFEDMVAGDNALRYVSPILAHGGIPKYSLDDFFRLVLRDAEKAADARDLTALWRTRKSAFFGVDAPVRRFVIYGGALAADFLDRCLDMIHNYARTQTVPKPTEVGLPLHVVAGFRRFADAVPATLRRSDRRWPRPEVRIDPWASTGPELVLPPVDFDDRVVWHLQVGGGHREQVEASRYDTRTVQLRPARSWSVSLAGGRDTLQERVFEGVDADEIAGLFFDPT